MEYHEGQHDIDSVQHRLAVLVAVARRHPAATAELLTLAVLRSRLRKQLVEKGILDKKLLTNLWLDIKPKLTPLQQEVSPAGLSSSRPLLDLSVAPHKSPCCAHCSLQCWQAIQQTMIHFDLMVPLIEEDGTCQEYLVPWLSPRER